LINALSSKKVYAADTLFATLGTTTAPVVLGHNSDGSPRTIIVHDTIGFIRDLPPELIKSFHSTLEDSLDTDYLLHVIDASDKNRQHKKNIVDTILHTI
jgi:GTP-binding protein HflX